MEKIKAARENFTNPDYINESIEQLARTWGDDLAQRINHALRRAGYTPEQIDNMPFDQRHRAFCDIKRPQPPAPDGSLFNSFPPEAPGL